MAITECGFRALGTALCLGYCGFSFRRPSRMVLEYHLKLATSASFQFPSDINTYSPSLDLSRANLQH